MFIILGGILSGVFMATESASIAVVWAFFVIMLIYSDYKWSELPNLMHRIVRTLSIVMVLIDFAVSFGYIMTLMQIPAKITTAFLTFSDSRYVIFVCTTRHAAVTWNADGYGPADSDAGDHQHWRRPGAFRHDHTGQSEYWSDLPPVGAVLFVGTVNIESTVKSLLPFYLLLLRALMLVTYIPVVSLWLPNTLL